MRIKNFGKIYNVVLLFTLLLLWLSVIVFKGFTGAIAWTLIKLVFAPIGLLLTLVSLFLFINGIIRNKKIKTRGISLLLSIIMAIPITMLFNIVHVPYPSNLYDVEPALSIYSPFKETTLIGWGGDSIESNLPHSIWASEKWAYDIIMAGSNLDSNRLEDYDIYKVALYAPISGTVIAAKDTEADILPNTEEFLSLEGNYIYLKVDETGTYLLMNHLLKDSITVEVGDRVVVGEYLGKVGNTGSTSEPHLHIHHQRQNPTKVLFPTIAEGLPLYFYNNEGKKTMPNAGDILKSNIDE